MNKLSVRLNEFEYHRRLRDLGDAWERRSASMYSVAIAQVYALYYMHGPLVVVMP